MRILRNLRSMLTRCELKQNPDRKTLIAATLVCPRVSLRCPSPSRRVWQIHIPILFGQYTLYTIPELDCIAKGLHLRRIVTLRRDNAFHRHDESASLCHLLGHCRQRMCAQPAHDPGVSLSSGRVLIHVKILAPGDRCGVCLHSSLNPWSHIPAYCPL